MRLNKLTPAKGSKQSPKRVGRGTGSGLGKTAGLGHKGQHARAGGYHKTGFEGGQMPLQRRLPKFGFNSPIAHLSAQIRLADLERLGLDEVDLSALKSTDLVPLDAERVKVIASGKLSRKVTLRGLIPSKGARAAIEAAGGKVED